MSRMCFSGFSLSRTQVIHSTSDGSTERLIKSFRPNYGVQAILIENCFVFNLFFWQTLQDMRLCVSFNASDSHLIASKLSQPEYDRLSYPNTDVVIMCFNI